MLNFFNMSFSKTVPLKDYNTHFALYRAKHMSKVRTTMGSGMQSLCYQCSSCVGLSGGSSKDTAGLLPFFDDLMLLHMDCLGIFHSNTARQVSIRFQRKDKMSQAIPVEK